MTDTSKKMVIGSMATAGVVALAAVADLITGYPFAGQTVMDILFLAAAGIVFYLGYDAWTDLK